MILPQSLTEEFTEENFICAIFCLNRPSYDNNHKLKRPAASIIIKMCETMTINPDMFNKLIDNHGRGLIHNYEYCVQYMINAGLNIYATNKNGNTPLHTNGNTVIIDLLLYNEANIYIKNNNGLTCDRIQKDKSSKKIHKMHRANIGVIKPRGEDNSSIRSFRNVFLKTFGKSYCDYCENKAYVNLRTGGFYCSNTFKDLYEIWTENPNRFYNDHRHGDSLGNDDY